MTKKVKDGKKKIETVLNSMNKKLKLDFTFVIEPITKELSNEIGEVILAISRSARSTEDTNTFIIYYNVEETSKYNSNTLKKHLFHEILHALCWPYVDEYEEVTKYITNKSLKNELEIRSATTRENVTYLLERKLGPICFPECDWSISE